MRRLASLVLWFFKPQMRYPAQDDFGLPFTSDEFARLIRSGRHEDFKRLADGLACQSIPRRAKHRAAH